MRQPVSGRNEMKPTKPGFYWALWTTATESTPEGDELTPARDWEVVEVWENFLIGEPCEADACEKWGVSVTGVSTTQWLENFQWGDGPLVRPDPKSKVVDVYSHPDCPFHYCDSATGDCEKAGKCHHRG